MIETNRLKIYAAPKEQMEAFIATQTIDVLKEAYTEMLDGCLAHPDQWNWYAIWMVELKDGTHIGELCFKGFSEDGVAEIGYGITDDYQGHGYATEAVDALIKWALQQEGVSCIEAEAEEDNVASIRVLEKCGFTRNGIIGEEGPRYERRDIDLLQDKDDDVAYATTKKIAAASEFSDKYYKCIPEFVKLLDHKKSYVRIRALILCCSQARWDEEGIIAEYLPQMLQLIHDEKPTVVRQSLNALKEVVVFRPELCEAIAAELENMDISVYKDSMVGLIQKDVNELKELMI